jgi:hypothetical protein
MKNKRGSVLQPWVEELTFMQQSVLISSVRGPDNSTKYGPVKMILRWYRRCILISAMEGEVLTDPVDPRGGSFTGPSYVKNSWSWQNNMDGLVYDYMKIQDSLPFHFQSHMMHAIEILGYKHPDDRIRAWWLSVYVRLVNALHLHPETEEEMDRRLGDSIEGWQERADIATQA